MASPPFKVEDQMDDNFFDKLADNENTVSESDPSCVDGVDFNEIKEFANFRVGEGGVVSEDFSGHKEKPPEKDILVSEENNSLVSSNSFVLSDGAESSNVAMGRRRSESGNINVKEVQWTAFSASDSGNQSGFGSYSDFLDKFGDGSVDPFANMGDNPTSTTSCTEDVATDLAVTSAHAQDHVGDNGVVAEQITDVRYWENSYPGWKYDPNTGVWCQVENYVATDQKSEVSYLQQTAQSVVGAVTEGCTTSSVYSCNQASQENTRVYPENMVFDPQYPGWYYDTIAQEWHLLETYTQAVMPTSTAYSHHIQDENSSMGSFPKEEISSSSEYQQVETNASHGQGAQNQAGVWFKFGLTGKYSQQDMSMGQPGPIHNSEIASGFTETQEPKSTFNSWSPRNNCMDQQLGFKPMAAGSLYEQKHQANDGHGRMTNFQSFLPTENYSLHLSQSQVEQSQQMHFLSDSYNSQNSGTYLHWTSTQFSSACNMGRSSAGRPPHAIATFGFGGKLIVMKGSSLYDGNLTYENQGSDGRAISILNLVDVVIGNNDTTTINNDVYDYFHATCTQSFPGPLVGGNVGSKELNKWIDERITNYESSNMDYKKRELLRLLLSLLKIACRHYGKLRSPFSPDPLSKENDTPESAVAKLFASAKRNGTELSGYGALKHCLRSLPSEGQLQATAAEVQNLLVSGRAMEALQHAQEGQLWGPALVLAAQLGEQFYVETMRQMAHCQLVAGSPLRTLCLLIAGQPADVFAADSPAGKGSPSPSYASHQPAQIGANCMLDDWEENLAIITANRTQGDELVVLHLGDCLWKERGEITAAHACYLVAEANFESYSDSARLCLLGADHWKFPRTYASPEAIQRTELYEYSLMLGNSQSVLLPFQPYKLIYAYMLTEVGKVSNALKYCQAILKSLKTGHGPEVEKWRQLVSSLEERIRIHQQGGFGTNLAPANLVGKLLPFIDKSIHRMIGAPLPPLPPILQSSIQSNEHSDQSRSTRVVNSQSTTVISSLMPSASMEPISEWTGDNSRMSMQSRSISEPDFGRSPRQVVLSKEAVSSAVQGKASLSSASSRFSRFGSQILQKTIGWVARSRPERQAKLGEKNKFYYDEKLKRWVEEGTELPSEETTLPPPPTTAAFQNEILDNNAKTAHRSGSLPHIEGPEIKSSTPMDHGSWIPPIPLNSNQFSARGQMGVRSRYVDTFNKGGGAQFQTHSVPAARPKVPVTAKIFIPTPSASSEQVQGAIGESIQEIANSNEVPSTSMMDLPFSSQPQYTSSSKQRFPSMDDIVPRENKGMARSNGSLSSHSRRTASWSGRSFSEANNPSKTTELKPLGEVLGMPKSSFMPSDPSSMHLPHSGSSADELQEVEL